MTLLHSLAWWCGIVDDLGAARRADLVQHQLATTQPIILIGGLWDDLETLGRKLDPHRPQLDVRTARELGKRQHGSRPPSAARCRAAFAESSPPFVLATNHRQASETLQVCGATSTYFLCSKRIENRRRDAVPLLRAELQQLDLPLDTLGAEGLRALEDYWWPRSMFELRETAHVLAAFIAGGNYTRAAAALTVSRQNVRKFLARKGIHLERLRPQPTGGIS